MWDKSGRRLEVCDILVHTSKCRPVPHLDLQCVQIRFHGHHFPLRRVRPLNVTGRTLEAAVRPRGYSTFGTSRLSHLKDYLPRSALRQEVPLALTVRGPALLPTTALLKRCRTTDEPRRRGAAQRPARMAPKRLGR